MFAKALDFEADIQCSLDGGEAAALSPESGLQMRVLVGLIGLIFSGCYCLDLPWKPVSILNVPTLFSKETQAQCRL